MRPILPVVLAAVLFVAGCTAPLQTDGGPTTADGEQNSSISVSGTGTASADPDLAVVSVRVSALEDDADAARDAVAEDSRAMFDALADAGVDTDGAVTTTFYRVAPEYDYRKDGRELVGYRAVHGYEVEVAPDQAGAVVDATVGAASGDAEDGIVVDGVQYTLTDETRAEVRAEALRTAVSAARTDADAIADAADLSITGVRTASTGGDFHPHPTPRIAESTGGDDAATTLHPGPVEVTATVSVTYDVE